MTRLVAIHPDNPQPRLLVQAAEFVREGALVALPTDSCYALCVRDRDGGQRAAPDHGRQGH